METSPIYQPENMFWSFGDLITINIFYESSRYNVVKEEFRYVEKDRLHNNGGTLLSQGWLFRSWGLSFIHILCFHGSRPLSFFVRDHVVTKSVGPSMIPPQVPQPPQVPRTFRVLHTFVPLLLQVPHMLRWNILGRHMRLLLAPHTWEPHMQLLLALHT